MAKPKLSRRDFLAGAAITSGAFLTGCSSGGKKSSAETEADAAKESDSSVYAPQDSRRSQ